MNYRPLVSTIIPTYKRANTLSRAIDSVLNQTYSKVEVIVVDDNNDNSSYRRDVEDIINKYCDDPRVIYIKHKNNMNGSAARNTGIKEAKGTYICFLDDDNYFYPDKIEKQVNYLLKHSEYKAAYCGLEYEDKKITPNREGDLTYEQLMGSNIIDTNMIIIEKAIALEIGGWDERLKRNQDVAFMLRYFRQGYEIGLVKEILAYIDLSDRLNAANPRRNEKNHADFLNYYESHIQECQKNNKNAKKNIYSFRFRGVFLNYIKNRDTIGAIKLYFKMMKLYPLVFNKYLIIGLIKKIKGEPLFEYGEQ